MELYSFINDKFCYTTYKYCQLYINVKFIIYYNNIKK